MASSDHGIALSFDEKLKSTIAMAMAKNVPMILTGDMYAGKTWGVGRVGAQLNSGNGYSLLELSKQSPETWDTLGTVIPRGNSKVIIEGTRYQIACLRELNGKHQAPPNSTPEGVAKEWARRIKESFTERRKGKSDPTSIKEETPTVQVRLTKDDMNSLFNYYADKVAKAHPDNKALSIEELQKRRERYLSICSWKGQPGDPEDTERFLIPSLLEEVISRHAEKGEARLKEIETKEHEKEGLAIAILGSIAIEGSASAVDAISKIGATLGPLVPFFGVLAPPLGAASVALLGASSIVNLYHRTKGSGYGQYVELWKAWNGLPEEKRKVLASRLDEKYALTPQSSFAFLDHWLGIREEQEFREELSKIFPDDLITQIKTIVDDYPQLKNQVKDIQCQVEQLRKDLSSLSDEVDGVKKDVYKLEERVTSVEQRSITQSPAPQQLSNNDHLRSGLGIPTPWTPMRNRSLQQKLDEIIKILSEGEPRKVVICGEGGIGKTTLLYLACNEMLSQGRRLYLDSTIGLEESSVLVADDIVKGGKFQNVVSGKVPFSVIATSRTEDWGNADNIDWQVIQLKPDDFDERTLKRILKDLVEKNGLRTTEQGEAIAIKKSEGLPIYLTALVKWLASAKLNLDEAAVNKAPPKVYQLIAEEVNLLVSKRDTATLATFFALAKTPRLRLQTEQITRVLKVINIEGSPSHELLSRGTEHYSLPHMFYRDVLVGEWSSLGIHSPLPNFLIDLREKNFQFVFQRALEIWATDDLKKLEPYYAVIGVRIALEIYPGLASELLEMVTKGGLRSGNFIADTIAQSSPETITLLTNGKSAEEILKLPMISQDSPWCSSILLARACKRLRNATQTGPTTIRLLAASLNNLGIALGATGQLQEALAAQREAVEIRRKLAEGNPGAFLPDLAMSLNNLGISLGSTGQLQEALVVLKEANEIRHRLKKEESYSPLK